MANTTVVRLAGRVFRVARVGRVFRLLKWSKGVTKVFLTLVLSLPSMINVGSLLLLVFFMFAVLGIEFFGGVSHQIFVGVHANFESLGLAYLTLFRVATGEAWPQLMYELSREEYGGSQAALVYFPVFVIVSNFVLLNLFVMILIDNFDLVWSPDSIDKATRARITMNETDVDNFNDAWRIFDRSATKFIRVWQVRVVKIQACFPMLC